MGLYINLHDLGNEFSVLESRLELGPKTHTIWVLFAYLIKSSQPKSCYVGLGDSACTFKPDIGLCLIVIFLIFFNLVHSVVFEAMLFARGWVGLHLLHIGGWAVGCSTVVWIQIFTTNWFFFFIEKKIDCFMMEKKSLNCYRDYTNFIIWVL